MDVFKVATIDQNLFLSGEKLLDNTQSLGQLRVLPGSAIFLKVSNVVNGDCVYFFNSFNHQGNVET